MTAKSQILMLVGITVLVASCGPNLAKYDWDKLSASSAYVIGPEDVLYVEFWKRPDVSKEVTVRPDGLIDLPLIGEINAAGLSPDDLKKVVTQKMVAFEKNPVVTISVKSVQSYRVYVLGKVTKPGLYQPSRKVTVLQALALAGGPTPFADEDSTVIIRREGDRELHIPFVYGDIVNGSHPKMNITLATGDTVVVP